MGATVSAKPLKHKTVCLKNYEQMDNLVVYRAYVRVGNRQRKWRVMQHPVFNELFIPSQMSLNSSFKQLNTF